MKTFWIQTLGCKVNHYESQQIARQLALAGLKPSTAADADLRVIHTCSVTTAAARQSRQSVRRVVRLPTFAARIDQGSFTGDPSVVAPPNAAKRSRVLVTGCWATSDRDAVSALAGVDAVVGHHEDIANQIDRLLKTWQQEDCASNVAAGQSPTSELLAGPESLDEFANGWIKQAGATASQLTGDIKPLEGRQVNQNLVKSQPQSHISLGVGQTFLSAVESAMEAYSPPPSRLELFGGQEYPHSQFDGRQECLPHHPGARNLPLLVDHQKSRQRAYLKIQDGCDAHCTYCIIPTLRTQLWSKPVGKAVEEARSLVAAGHVELVLTGIFLGAYNQPTALRRRQPRDTGKPLGELVESLCTQVTGLKRLRLSSLEPGDLTAELLAVLKSHPQIMPHFHLPLQSGSDLILRRMNRQYTREDYLRMVERLNQSFDRPALTTDIVVGFPGEDDAEFEQTREIVSRSNFIHVHAFPFSPRPGTAAARWTDQFIHGPVVNQRIEELQSLAAAQSLRFRESFLGQSVQVIVERDGDNESSDSDTTVHHGRCERYFDVQFIDPAAFPGQARIVRITQVLPNKTSGAPASSPMRDKGDAHI